MGFNRDRSLLYPPFAGQLYVLDVKLKRAGLSFYLFNGIRTVEEQDELYAKGRTKPGERVTNARGGYSWHNFGLAADMVLDGNPDKPGIQWSWNLRADLNNDGAADYRQMAQIARDCGLEAGYFWTRFPDAAHVQNRYGLTLNEARELHADGGLQAVWDFIAAGEAG